MIAEYCYCHIDHLSPVEARMLFDCSHFLCLQGIILWCVNTEFSIHWHTVVLCQFWWLQKPGIILKDVGMGEISILCIQCCRVCCFMCEMYNLCLNFSLWWFWELQGCFKCSLPVLCCGRWLWCSRPLEGKDSKINKQNNWFLGQCTCNPGSCTHR